MHIHRRSESTTNTTSSTSSTSTINSETAHDISPTMAKLIVLALALAALLALASAHRTIVRTTIEDDDIDNPQGSQQQCRQEVQRQRFNQCQRYLSQQDQSPYGDDNPRQQQQGLQQYCCRELRNVDERCQCEAVKQVFRQAQQQQQQGQQGGRYGSQQMRRLKQMAQSLPQQCNLEIGQCEFRTILATTTIGEDDFARGSQQCRRQIQRHRFDQCQRYMSQESSPYDKLLMTINPRQQQQQQQDVQPCCEELQKVDDRCQCEAVEEVFRQAQQQQQEGRQQGRRRGEQQPMRELHQKAQNLPRQCNLAVQQCRIPAAWF